MPDSRSLATLASLRDRDLASEGLFVAEGRTLVERAISSGLELLEIAGTEATLSCLSLPPSTKVTVLSSRALSELAGFPFHRGVMASGRIPPPPDLIPDAATSCARYLACVDVQDPENLGAMIRSASAFAWDAVLLCGNTVSPWSRKALRASMGATFGTRMVAAKTVGDLASLMERGGSVVATCPNEGIPIRDFAAGLNAAAGAHQGALTLMIGNEFGGLSSAWFELADCLISIPMRPGQDSLNAAAAAAICLYELAPKSS